MKQSNPDYEIRKELRQAIACDIGDPVRTIYGFARLLLEDPASSLSEEGKGFVKLIIAASERIKRTAHDLGLIFGIKAFPPQIKKCDVGAVVQSICEELSSSLKGVIVNLPKDLPIIQADQWQLKELFWQFLHNTVKCNRKSEKYIELNWYKRVKAYEFIVSGNALGISPAYSAKSFLLIDKVSLEVIAEQEHEPGVGLAICWNIVESHGGKFWIESAKGAGPSFHFTIPDTGSQAGERQNEQE